MRSLSTLNCIDNNQNIARDKVAYSLNDLFLYRVRRASEWKECLRKITVTSRLYLINP